MATIGERVYADGSDKFISLGNEEWLRTLSIGTDWTILRFGLIFSLNMDGANNITSTEFAFGLCSGLDKGYGTTTANWVGGTFGDTFGATSTQTYGAGPPTTLSIVGTSSGRKVGAVATSFQNNAGAWNSPTVSTPRKSMASVQITKGSPNYSVIVSRPASANFADNWSFRDLILYMEQTSMTQTMPGPKTWTGTTLASGAFSEAAGPLSTLSIYWNKSLFPVEIQAVAAYRFG